MLRDAVARLFPTELKSRQEGLMYDELESGNVSEAALRSLVDRLSAPENVTDMGSLLSMVSLMVTAGIGGTAQSQVSAMHMLREFDKVVWKLLGRSTDYATEQIIDFQSILTSLTGAIETLAEHLSDTAGWSSKELGCLTNDAVHSCGCVWSLLPEAQEVSSSQASRMFFAVSLLESYCLVAGRERLQIQLYSETIVGVVGMLLALLREAQKPLANRVEENSAVATCSTRRMAIEALGSLAASIRSDKIVSNPIWSDLCAQLLDTMQTDTDFSVAGVAAQTCASMLDVNLCPADALCTWLPALLDASIMRLSTVQATRDSVASHRLLALLGDVHRVAPASEMGIISSLVGNGKFTLTCRILETAGELSKKIEFAASDDSTSLALGSLEAWEGILLLLQELEAAHVEEGLSPWIGPLIAFLEKLPAGEVASHGLKVFIDLLRLASKVRGQIEMALTNALAQYPSIFTSLLASSSSEQAEELARLRKELNLLQSQSCPFAERASAPIVFGGSGGSSGSHIGSSSTTFPAASSINLATTTAPAHIQGRRILRARRRRG